MKFTRRDFPVVELIQSRQTHMVGGPFAVGIQAGSNGPAYMLLPIGTKRSQEKAWRAMCHLARNPSPAICEAFETIAKEMRKVAADAKEKP